MKELEKEFIGKGQVKGFKFTQVKKTKNGHIYKVERFGRVWYEVFKRVENVRFSVVSYPSNKAFGVWAWTTNDKNRGFDILEELNLKALSDEG